MADPQSMWDHFTFPSTVARREGDGVDVESLRYIVTLSEELHFGRSASRHYIGEVQFGRRVRQIESELGVQVFQ